MANAFYTLLAIRHFSLISPLFRCCSRIVYSGLKVYDRHCCLIPHGYLFISYQCLAITVRQWVPGPQAQISLRCCLQGAALLLMYFLSVIADHITLVIIYSQSATSGKNCWQTESCEIGSLAYGTLLIDPAPYILFFDKKQQEKKLLNAQNRVSRTAWLKISFTTQGQFFASLWDSKNVPKFVPQNYFTRKWRDKQRAAIGPQNLKPKWKYPITLLCPTRTYSLFTTFESNSNFERTCSIHVFNRTWPGNIGPEFLPVINFFSSFP